MRNTIALGDSEFVLQDLPAESVDLVFTSPPYYNARPEYTDYITYEEYLLKLRKIIQNIHRVLAEGRFFAINISPVLIRRANRTEASRCIAVPFDVHRLFIEEGYDFIDLFLQGRCSAGPIRRHWHGRRGCNETGQTIGAD